MEVSETMIDNLEKLQNFAIFWPWEPEFWPKRKIDWNSVVFIFDERSNVFFFVFLYDQ